MTWPTRRERTDVQLNMLDTLVSLVREGRHADLEPLVWTVTVGGNVMGRADWPWSTPGGRLEAFEGWCRLVGVVRVPRIAVLPDGQHLHRAWCMRGDVRVELEATV